MTREEYRQTVRSDVYGNPRFIIHFLDLVHEDHPGDHCDKMESARRMANKHGGRRYRGRVFGGGFIFQVYGLDLLIDELYNDIYKKIAKYEINDGHLFDTREEAVKHIDASIGTLTSRISHALLNKKWSEIGDWVLDNLKTFKELIDLNNELNDETDE